ncbi:MAG: hypothetical protein M3131_04920, partial [Actinomycetota bacterium]|nr:hypothetical protein [Actinomycetota bacterium]
MTAASPDRPPVPDVEEVRRIVAIPSPVIRNLEITHCYSRLAAAVAARTGEGANWCTYATWASRQAGGTIRGEDFLDHLERRLGEGFALLHPVRSLWLLLLRRGLFRPDTRLGRLTARLHTPFDAFELASDAVARGNKKVFEEIGLEFARYLEECPEDAPLDSAELRAFLEGLRPGDPPDGQRYLRQAFTRYQRQRFEADPKARTELAFLANLEIGMHEQTRLQPEIREALDAPYATKEDLGRRLLEVLFPRTAGWRASVKRPLAAPIRPIGSSAQRAASDLAREVITESFMVLSLPGQVLSLGTHLDEPYPEALGELRSPELIELLAQFEPAAPAHDDCGARDWSDFHQRMHYIVHLFRAFHAREDLSTPPFTEAQVAAFLA